MNLSDEQEVETVTATIEVRVPVIDWIDYLTKNADIFGREYIGHWACGVKHHPDRGWLVFEDHDGDFREKKEPDHDKAVKAWEDGTELPPRWFRLDKAMAIRAFVEGVRLWGDDWFERLGDANTYDEALQMAMLKEHRYC